MRRLAPISPFFFLTLGLVTVGIAVGALAQAAIPAEALLDRVVRAESLADAGMSNPSRVRMTQIRNTLGFPVIVEIDGWAASIDPDPTLEGLVGDDPADFRRAGVRVRVVREGLEEAMEATAVAPDDVATALDAAYRGSIQLDPGILERIRRAVAELIQGFLSNVFAFRGAGTLVAWGVIVGLGLLALWLLRRLRFVPETEMEVVGLSSGRRRVDWLARAEEAVRAGDLHRAVHAFYRGLLSALAGRGLLMDVPGLTAGECRSTVRIVRPDLFDAVADATGTFERVAYGGVRPGTDEVDTLRRAVTLARSA